MKGLRGINGNIYVPCLGGLGAEMPPGYPVGAMATLPLTRLNESESSKASSTELVEGWLTKTTMSHMGRWAIFRAHPQTPWAPA